jgi:hypothetical protein
MRAWRPLLPVMLFFAASTALAQNLQTGFPPFGSFVPGAFDSLNIQNLNTHFSVPMVTSPGREISLRLSVVYDSLLWAPVTVGSTTSWTPVPAPNSKPNWGWTASPAGVLTSQTEVAGSCKINGSLVYYDKVYDYVYFDPTGTAHGFPTVSWYYNPCLNETFGTKSGYASDSTGYCLSNASSIYTRSGVKISPGSQIEDTNGNYVSSTVVNGSETDWKDSGANAALKIISGTSSIQYQFLDPTGAYQTTTMNLATFNIKTNFGCSGVVEYTGTASLPTSIVLPDGKQYTFSYEPTAVSRILLKSL